MSVLKKKSHHDYEPHQIEQELYIIHLNTDIRLPKKRKTNLNHRKEVIQSMQPAIFDSIPVEK